MLINVYKRAVSIKRTLGVRRAAGYLRNQGVPLEAALLNLGFPVRFPKAT
jgi:hypothetical protein